MVKIYMKEDIYKLGEELGLNRDEIEEIISRPTELYKAGTRYGTVSSAEIYKAGTEYGTVSSKDVYKAGTFYGTVSSNDVYKAGTYYGTISIKDF